MNLLINSSLKYQTKDFRLFEELILLTKNSGFDTNYGLCNSNYTKFTPFLFENSVKVNELKAIKKSIPSFSSGLCSMILEYSHQYFATSDFMHIIISYFNKNPSLIPTNMNDYHRSKKYIQWKQKLKNINVHQIITEEAKFMDTTYDELSTLMSGWGDETILSFQESGKARRKREKMENEVKQQVNNIGVEAVAKLYDVSYTSWREIFKYSDSQILNIVVDAHERKYYPKKIHKEEESKDVNILTEYVETMEQNEYNFHFPLNFKYFSRRQIMNIMITDHEEIIEENPCPDQQSQKKFDEFVRNVNMLEKIVEFVQNNTFNSRIYSIPDRNYWDAVGNHVYKYWGTVFVFGETQNGNLLGFYFDQSVSI